MLCLQCLCFILSSWTSPFFLFLTITIFCPPPLFFVVHLCVRLVFLYPTDAALLVDSPSANANAEWNNKCVYSQCSCHLDYSGSLLKEMRPHRGLIRFQGDCRRPLRGAIPSAVWINNIRMTSPSYLLVLKATFVFKWRQPVIGLVESSLIPFVVTFSQTLDLLFKISLSLTHTCIQSAELIFSWMHQSSGDPQFSKSILAGWNQALNRLPVVSSARLAIVSRVHVHLFYRCVLHLSAGCLFFFHRDSTSDVLFIQVEEIRRFSCHQSPLNGKCLYLGEPALISRGLGWSSCVTAENHSRLNSKQISNRHSPATFRNP